MYRLDVAHAQKHGGVTIGERRRQILWRLPRDAALGETFLKHGRVIVKIVRLI
jgi:hypothetical protein